MKSIKFLDQIIEKESLKNYAALAKRLNLRQSTISMYRSGERIMDNETCAKVAMALNIDPLEVIIAADLDRAEKSGQRSIWEVFLNRTARAASTVALSALIPFNVNYFLTVDQVMPKESTPYEHNVNNNINYANYT